MLLAPLSVGCLLLAVIVNFASYRSTRSFLEFSLDPRVVRLGSAKLSVASFRNHFVLPQLPTHISGRLFLLVSADTLPDTTWNLCVWCWKPQSHFVISIFVDTATGDAASLFSFHPEMCPRICQHRPFWKSYSYLSEILTWMSAASFRFTAPMLDSDSFDNSNVGRPFSFPFSVFSDANSSGYSCSDLDFRTWDIFELAIWSILKQVWLILVRNQKMTEIRYRIFFEAGVDAFETENGPMGSDFSNFVKSEIREIWDSNLFCRCQNKFESWKSVWDRFSQIRTLVFGFVNEKSQIFLRFGYFSFGSDFFRFLGP